MDTLFWFNVLMRWLHVSAAVVGVGALVLMRLVVPAAEACGLDGARTLLASLRPGFQRLVHASVAVLLLTGFYNFYRVIPAVNELGELKSTYHMLVGIKILLAFGFFAVATAWVASRRAEQRLAQALMTGIVLAAVILFISATLRRTWDLHPRLATSGVGTPAGTAPNP